MASPLASWFGEASMLASVLSVFAAAAFLPLTYRHAPRIAPFLPSVLAAVLFSAFAARLPLVVNGDILLQKLEWFDALSVSAAFALDGLSLTFALLITGVGALVFSYSVGYIGRQGLARLHGLLLLFMGSMLGLVLADDAITMFVFWELTSISSFFLIAFDDTALETRKKAEQALVVTSAGGLLLLVGLVLLGSAAEELGTPAETSRRLSALSLVDVRAHAHYSPIVFLVAFGAFTKSAQVPFHFWLPGAMVAPTPVSAYLHSATMVKAGVYLLARLNPTLGGTALWTVLLGGVGAITLLTGSFVAVFQRDLKLTLAYSTVAVLGALTMLIGLGTRHAVQGFAVLLLAHAAYKAAMFLIAGNVGHHEGTRDPFALRGLAAKMPATAVAAVFAAASMAGIPPLFGFIGKEGLVLGALSSDASLSFIIAAVAGGALMVIAAGITGVMPFFGNASWTVVEQHAVTRSMVVPPLLLAAIGLCFGLLPGVFVEPLAIEVASVVSGRAERFDVALWHGFSGARGVALLLGTVSLGLGLLGYVILVRTRTALDRLARVESILAAISPAHAYTAALNLLRLIAHRTTLLLQGGLLRRYVMISLVFSIAAIATPLIFDVRVALPAASFDVRWYEWGLILLAGASAICATRLDERLSAIAALGVTGLAIAFLFALFSAPDLAITQLMVETLMVILLVLVFRRLPPRVARLDTTRRIAKFALCTAVGATITLLLLAISVAPAAPDAAEFHIAESPRQHSDNVVNAILTNFRALDTLGEITVLAIAGLGVFALLRLNPSPERK